MMRSAVPWLVLAALCAPDAAAQFVNFETPQVHPIELTPDGTRLLVVNTADNRLEVFSLSAGVPVRVASIPVGLEPVSVRARSNTQAWVVNQLSDSVSIVDLTARNVVDTIKPGDEPADVVFAGVPERAFVSVSQENRLAVYDPSNLTLAPVSVAIQGEEPRALLTDGVRVYAAIFESGNGSSILTRQTVSGPLNPYPGDPNPPPNAGASFIPAIAGGLPPPPPVSLLVQKVGAQWFDDNAGDWTPAVTWDVLDNDVAVIDASTLGVTYAQRLMNANMAIGAGPTGQVYVVGTDATNVVRFEPNVRSTFVRVMMARFAGTAPASPTIVDLNPHLGAYTVQSIPPAQREQSIGDPRAVAFLASGAKGYVTGMGSNNVAIIDAVGARLGRIDVGEGPTGLAIDEPRGQVYVLNRFDGSISVLSIAADTELARISYFDPTPPAVEEGRPFLYDTHLTSGLGQASCASCHIDARIDQLAWDLGDPAGQIKMLNQPCQGPAPTCGDWHPMKGPLTTQTLFGLQGVGGLHWRADRENLAAFNPAFPGLLARDAQLTTDEMNKFTAFTNTLAFPPNPNRTFTNGLRSSLPNGGNAQAGSNIFINRPIVGPLACAACHALPNGTNGQITPAAALMGSQSIKIPQLRNMYDKTGFFSLTSAANNKGFGFSHDGTIPTLFDFLRLPVFTGFAAGALGDQERRDVEAFMLSFATPTHPAVGAQATVISIGTAPPAVVNLLNQMLTVANNNQAGLVVKGKVAGEQRGWRYNNGAALYQSDRAAETINDVSLRALAAAGSELTWTVVPNGSQTRIGIDRDLDGALDRDELDARSNPADPASLPVSLCAGDADGSRTVAFADITAVLTNFGADYGELTGPGDANRDGLVNFADITAALTNFGASCP